MTVSSEGICKNCYHYVDFSCRRDQSGICARIYARRDLPTGFDSQPGPTDDLVISCPLYKEEKEGTT